ncbi:MAG: dihydrolipoyllysine-residue acetyltransferase [Acidobacteria bacterium]|nr:dihydrolipoyllysine-residue acetyltransferase [Acidobacteriota bacterium]
MSEPTPITVPAIGGAEDVTIAEVLVAAGDEVRADQSLVILGSDKASMEVPAPSAGTVMAISVSVGDTVSEGSVILSLDSAKNDPAPAETSPPVEPAAPTPKSVPHEPAVETRPAPVIEPSVALTAADLPYASPGVRRMAREKNVDLAGVSGTGRNGRITTSDVEAAASGPSSATGPGAMGTIPMPDVDFSQFGEVEHVRLTRINRLTGENLHRSWVNVPHVTQFDEADITELEAFRKSRKAEAEAKGVKLTFVSFLLAASAAALREFSRFNSSLSNDGSEVVLKKYVNIGIAVDTPKGLVVPVVKDVDKKRLFELAADLMDISSRAREGKLTPADFQGGCFTISSLGGIGGTAFTPIVNAPEVAILGASRSRMQPVWNGEEFTPRLMLPLSLSYDHRVIDGAAAARFTTRLGQILADLRNLLL